MVSERCCLRRLEESEALKTNWHGATVPSSGQNKKSHLFCFSLMPSVGFDHDTQAVLIIMDRIWEKRHAHTCPNNDSMRASKTGAHSSATHFQNCIFKKKTSANLRPEFALCFSDCCECHVCFVLSVSTGIVVHHL